mmetsp:Transcript_95433/g.270150  ORF Transcript_95433/g.270150 Transcript_95433/m.270150 type:complete len:240 (+) Transcript_95433:762-1481(+)
MLSCLLAVVGGRCPGGRRLQLAALLRVFRRLGLCLREQVVLVQHLPAVPECGCVVVLAQAHVGQLDQCSILKETRLALEEVAGLVPRTAATRRRAWSFVSSNGCSCHCCCHAAGAGASNRRTSEATDPAAAARVQVLGSAVGAARGRARPLRQHGRSQDDDVPEAHGGVDEGPVADQSRGTLSILRGGLPVGRVCAGSSLGLRAAVVLVPAHRAPADGRAPARRQQPPPVRTLALDAPG